LVYTAIYTKGKEEVIVMMTAKIFENGRSQAVRLPKECRFSSDEVMINKIGEIVILLPKTNKWDSFMQAVDMFSDDFMADGRAEDNLTEREAL
jgi:antitoxin VapB